MAEEWGMHPADVLARTTLRWYQRWRVRREAQRAAQDRRHHQPINPTTSGPYRITELS